MLNSVCWGRRLPDDYVGAGQTQELQEGVQGNHNSIQFNH